MINSVSKKINYECEYTCRYDTRVNQFQYRKNRGIGVTSEHNRFSTVVSFTL